MLLSKMLFFHASVFGICNLVCYSVNSAIPPYIFIRIIEYALWTTANFRRKGFSHLKVRPHSVRVYDLRV